MTHIMLSLPQIKEIIKHRPYYSVSEDLIVHNENLRGRIPNEFISSNEDGCKFNVKFGVCTSFVCDHRGLISLRGSPKLVMGRYEIENALITELDGICEEAEIIDISKCKHLNSLKNIGKYVKKCKRIFIDPYSINCDILGSLLISGLIEIRAGVIVLDSNRECVRAIKIINKYLNTGCSSIIDCQRELIKEGLKDYAKL